MLTVAAPFLAHPGPWHDGGGGPGWWVLFPIGFGLFWVAVAASGFWLLRRRTVRPGPRTEDPRAKAESVLAERFARGDIDEDEYYARLATLQQSR
jgi:putative membrane protein